MLDPFGIMKVLTFILYLLGGIILLCITPFVFIAGAIRGGIADVKTLWTGFVS